ncbi:MAG: HAD family phosphatase [Desulfurivibrionaceae bacterium]|nr:HAD family phosphatase [Desulfobulbales bacterium]MDT8335946.1 HAD family phosphatase [Desulfurivibrionaceae bacterium]
MGGENSGQLRIFLFDYGGVLAEEGFAAGLKAIAVANDLAPELFFHRATEIIYDCGYVTGKGTADDYWRLVRREFPLREDGDQLTGAILDRFVLRPGMIAKVRAIKMRGMGAAILSDQTDWLDILDRRDNFLAEFDPILNSYYLGATKRDPATFIEAARIIGVPPEHILFIDDNPGHIDRAAGLGLQTHLFTSESNFGRELEKRGVTLDAFA